MLWHEQTWPDIQSLDKQTPVVVPLASMEQHGHHLPLFVDTMQVTAIADEVEKQMGDQMLLTPTLWLGSSHHHNDFPGTISARPGLFSAMVRAVAESVLRAGFRRIFFLNGHGGNEVPASQAINELVADDDTANDALVVFGSWWHVGRDAIKPEKHGMKTRAVTHACEYETSMMLHLRPDLVHMDRFRETGPRISDGWANTEYGGKVTVYHRFATRSASGNMAKGNEGTPQKGEGMFKGVVADVIAFLDDFRSWPLLERIGPK
jgi:creatinine amidohydrolase